MNRVTLKPRFVGPRFDKHSLPLDVLEGLVVMQDIVFEISRWIYLRDNPDKSQAPRGLKQNSQLAIRSIKKGSAIPQLVPAAAGDFLEVASLADQSAALMMDVISAFNADGRPVLPEGFPASILAKFPQVRAGLTDAEQVCFRHEHKLVVLSKRACDKMTEWSQAPAIELRRVRGRIVGLESENLQLSFRTFDQKLSGKVKADDFRGLVSLFAAPYQPMLELVAQVALGDNGRIERIVLVKNFDVISTDSMRKRIQRLLEIDPHWLAAVPDRATVAHTLVAWWEAFATPATPLPKVFPSGEALLELEWVESGHHTIVEFDPTTGVGELSWYREGDVESIVREVRLSDSASWALLETTLERGLA